MATSSFRCVILQIPFNLNWLFFGYLQMVVMLVFAVDDAHDHCPMNISIQETNDRGNFDVYTVHIVI